MPAAPTTPKRASQASTSSPYTRSPKKAWVPSWTFDFPPRNSPLRDESTWRKSTISPTSQITKTDAKEKYHLRAEELGSLTPVIERYDIPFKSFQGKRELYTETAVELIAWRKYGGPTSFERFLREARANYTGFKTPFKYPPAYLAALTTPDPQPASSNQGVTVPIEPGPADKSGPSSPKKWTPAWTFDFPPSNSPLRDQTTWRASTIPSTQQIKKTDAKEQYHLRAEELDGLTAVTEWHDIQGKNFRGKTLMFNEVEVERIAWKKYGGPESFERFLKEACENYTGMKTPFKYPSAYGGNFNRVRVPGPRSTLPMIPYDEMSAVQQVVCDMGF